MILADPEKLEPFNPKLKAELHTDASKKGLGFVLVQVDDQGEKHIIHAGSIATKDVQTQYSPIELEALAGMTTMDKCSYYIRGIPFVWLTDHKLLEAITMKTTNIPRILSYFERMAVFQYT